VLVKYRNTIIASLGVALEYYDFLIYGLLGVYLTDVFFLEGQFSSLRYFSVFSLGYIFMPLGGLVFGLISDKYGRIKAFSFLLLMMALSTIVMGLMPTGGTIAVILIIAARIIQGIAFGGELPNALTLVYESSRRDAMHTGIISSSYAAGNILALLVMYLISKTLNHEQIISFGWRIPFLFGGILSVISYMLRRRLLETPEFSIIKNEVKKKEWLAPLKALLKFSKFRLLLAMVLSIGTRAMTVFFIYLPTYLTHYSKYEANTLYLAMTGALGFSLIIAPMLGKFADICGKKKFIAGFAIILVTSMPYLSKNLDGSIRGLFMFVALYQLCLTAIYVSGMTLISSLFPTEYRNTGLSFCCGISYAISGVLPVIVAGFLDSGRNGALSYFFWFVSFVIIMSIMTLGIFNKEVANDR